MKEISKHLNMPVNRIQSYVGKIGLKRAKSMHIHEYAMYDGDEFEMIGTAYEIGKALNIKPESVAWYSSSVNLKRVEKNNGKGRVAVRLDE